MGNRIIYGLSLIDKNGEEPTHRVTGFYLDRNSDKITFIIEKGIQVNQVNLDMYECQSLGIMNFDKLEPFCK